MSGAYYNEMDPYAAQWLRNLIAAGHIAPGDVDERSIRDVSPEDLRGYTQCHFFAGIGVWSHALRNAGWSDDRPVWTGSCPCQPFSAAGKQKGFDDDRHLWPVWHKLIDQCRPAIVLGEQVASALDWLDLVSADLEASGYAFAASDLCAAGFGGAHIRQRLYFAGVGDGQQPRLEGHAGDVTDGGGGRNRVDQLPRQAHLSGWPDGLGDTDSARATIGLPETVERESRDTEINDNGSDRLFRPGARRSITGGLADAEHDDPRAVEQERGSEGRGPDGRDHPGLAGPPAACAPLLGRTPADWLFCRDGKWRPVEPGTFPLADAPAARVGRLRAYGNALDAETATQFVGAVMDATADLELI